MRAAPVALLIALAAVSACSTTDAGTPVPSAGGPGATTGATTAQEPAEGTPASAPTSAESGAPRVADPVDTARFQKRPCSSLTAAQTEELGVEPPGTERPNQNGLGCFWQNDNGGTISVLWTGLTGLDALYRTRERSAYFEPVEIAGFPAVAAEPTDDRETGACSVHVGTSDDAMFTLALQQSRGRIGEREPCVVAVGVAGQVLATVKGG